MVLSTELSDIKQFYLLLVIKTESFPTKYVHKLSQYTENMPRLTL